MSYKVGDRVVWNLNAQGSEYRPVAGVRGTVKHLKREHVYEDRQEGEVVRVAVRWDNQTICRPHDWLYPEDVELLDATSALGELS